MTNAAHSQAPSPDHSEAQLVEFPLTRTHPFGPPPEYQGFRDEAAITRVQLPSGQCPWLLTRHEDIRAMLTDPRFSSDRFNPGFPLLLRSGRLERGRLNPSLINLDPPEHGTARRQVVGEFTVNRMRALQPRIQQIVDEHIDAILAGPNTTDLVSTLSLPVPSLVTCELLGVPYTDHEFFQGLSSTLLNRQVTQDVRQQAVDKLMDYLGELVAGKEAEPTDDLLGRQIRLRRESGDYDRDELVSLASLLLIAGHETTANMISLGTLALMENPETRAALAADPAKTPGAVEEMLRYFTVADLATSRVARADVEIAGQLIRAGEGVLGLSYSANRDEAAFADADELDIERGARHHLAFGFGPHQCLGQNLARIELQIVFDTLLRRIPELRLAVPVEQLPFKHDSAVFGLYCLPVTW
jgi:cytochrome P450